MIYPEPNYKIKDYAELEKVLAYYRFKDEKIVFTNGCFDIIHAGHVNYLYKASLLGQSLILGLNSDNSVKRLKGQGRPVLDGTARALVLASFYFVDLIVFFDEDTPYNLIKLVQPDVLVKGADYKEEDIVGYDIVTAKGGKVVTISLTEGESTSNLIKRIKLL